MSASTNPNPDRLARNVFIITALGVIAYTAAVLFLNGL